MPSNRPDPAPGSAYARYGAKIVTEKLRILRLIRALDRAGVDPRDELDLQTALVRLAAFDMLFTSTLEVIDREGRKSGEISDSIEPLFRIAEEVRGDVVDVLDPEDQEQVLRASDEVAVSEPEVWMEVEGLRRQGNLPRSRRGLALPLPVDDVERAGRRAFAADWPPRLPGRRNVLAEESRPLPPTDVPLSAWFERLPSVWLEATAKLNDVEIEGGDASLAVRVAERLADAVWISRLLSERVGVSGREILAPLLVTGSAPFAAMSRRQRSAFEVPWDWRERVPAADGGKLRALGLLHVGTRDRAKVVEVPPPLLVALLGALQG